ncbi:MAG: aminotransferase class I/II-fold pyridoxal phosphate-dependent enzyme [Acidobacteriota bacterium]
MSFEIFTMERWQSTYEHEVLFNLSESGVEPLTIGELLQLSNVSAESLLGIALEYNHSRGTPLLRERIAALYPGASPANVLVTNGGAEANYLLTWDLLAAGDELVFMSPNYMQAGGLARNFGVSLREWRLREDNGWLPDPDALSRLVSDRTKAILVTNPNNPTGSILPEETMDAVAEAADRVGAWIIADEIYRGAELQGPETPTFWGRSERVLVTAGLSKAYGLPGLRLGWAIVPANLVEELWAHKDYTTIAMGTISDRLAAAALTEDVRPRLIERTRSILNANWPIMEKWLQARSETFRWHPPQAGAIVYVGYDLPIDSLELAERLRTEVDCLVVPGAHFEMQSYLRLGFGPEASKLSTALERCASLIDELRIAT